MVYEINGYEASRIMRACGYDFTICGMDALIEWYDMMDENARFNPFDIAYEWTEYSGTLAGLENIVEDYAPEEDRIIPNELSEVEGNPVIDMSEEENRKKFPGMANLLDNISGHTTILFASNGNILVQSF